MLTRPTYLGTSQCSPVWFRVRLENTSPVHLCCSSSNSAFKQVANKQKQNRGGVIKPSPSLSSAKLRRGGEEGLGTRHPPQLTGEGEHSWDAQVQTPGFPARLSHGPRDNQPAEVKAASSLGFSG